MNDGRTARRAAALALPVIIAAAPVYTVLGRQALPSLSAAGPPFAWIPFNIHSFIPKQFKIERAPGSGIGITPVGYVPTLLTTEMPDGYRLRYIGGRWIFQPEVRK